MNTSTEHRAGRQRRRRQGLIVITAIGFASIAGCGSSSTARSTPTTSTPTSNRSSTTSSSKPAAAQVAAITISSYTFMPNVATVPAGTITIENKDQEIHTFTSGTPGTPDGMFDVRVVPGEPAHVTVKQGTYSYFCNIHRNMTGKLIVQ